MRKHCNKGVRKLEKKNVFLSNTFFFHSDSYPSLITYCTKKQGGRSPAVTVIFGCISKFTRGWERLDKECQTFSNLAARKSIQKPFTA